LDTKTGVMFHGLRFTCVSSLDLGSFGCVLLLGRLLTLLLIYRQALKCHFLFSRILQ
jgi:hypothetical protein